MGALFLIVALAASPVALHAAEQREGSSTAANPIRKVVTMLQAMQKKVTEEGEQEEALYKRFMCYCKNSGGDLAKSIQSGEAKVSGLGPDIKRTEERKAQADAALADAQDGRAAAKKALAEATALREKEAAAYAAEKAEYGANAEAISRAVTALEKGVAGAFLQTGAADALRRLAKASSSAIADEDREVLLAFLEGAQGSGYVPQSGQITGILKEMGDEMARGFAEAKATEEAAIAGYEELAAAKTKEVKVLTAKIESTLERIAELGVSVSQLKNDLGDTEEALLADQEFSANLEKSCTTKTAEWEERTKTRADELVALADTIKVLNDDDALDLFKKTLPSAAASFVQVQSSAALLRTRAAETLRRAQAAQSDRVRTDLILLALRGKKIGFEKVISMIDDMVATLKTEQADDDKKKEYCAAQFDLSDDKKKGLERTLSDTETAISKAEDDIATLKEEIAALSAGIKALDKSVAEATADRKAEHSDFTQLMASDSAAKELLGFAKNRLNKFYNPKMYKPPAKRELAAQDRIAVNLGGGTAPPTPAPGGIAGTGIAVLAEVAAHRHLRADAAPPPPPETFDAYTKKSEMNTGVIAMIDLLIKDLDKEMAEAETEEKDAQADYETMMKDSAEKRVADSKSLSQKETAVADLQVDLVAHKDAKGSTTKELAATLKYISSLHAECDWLLQYFDVRASARASEIDALGKAKAVLSGADYSLLQMGSRGSLRGSA